ncbi:MAG: hypothetical protein IV090_20330 [Candidatus Sericytochromatia bacterium]|nr:hypothetical protein [Candidatus Sericytochromatia bacterium]
MRAYSKIIPATILLSLIACGPPVTTQPPASTPDTVLKSENLKGCYKQEKTITPIICFDPKKLTTPDPNFSFDYAWYDSATSTATRHKKVYEVKPDVQSLTLFTDEKTNTGEPNSKCASIKFVGSDLYLSAFRDVKKSDCTGTASEAIHKWETTTTPQDPSKK